MTPAVERLERRVAHRNCREEPECEEPELRSFAPSVRGWAPAPAQAVSRQWNTVHGNGDRCRIFPRSICDPR